MSARPDLPSLPPQPFTLSCQCGRTFLAPLGYQMHRCADGCRPVEKIASPADIAAWSQELRQSVVLDVLTAADDPWVEANPELYRVIR